MAGMNLFVLCLATLQHTSGQFWREAWNEGWNQIPWGSQIWGHNRQREQSASRAVCTRTVHECQIAVTIKRSSDGGWGNSLELEITASCYNSDNRKKFDLVLTEFGADDNEGGCTVENLGNIVKRRNRWDSWMRSSRKNGIIGVVDVTGDGMFTGTFHNLPFSSLEEAFGCGVALCLDTETVDGDSGSWGWGWGSSREKEMRCKEPITLCCHLGKSEDDVNAPENKYIG